MTEVGGSKRFTKEDVLAGESADGAKIVRRLPPRARYQCRVFMNISRLDDSREDLASQQT